MNIPFLHNATKANEKLAELSGQLGSTSAALAAMTSERDALKSALAERDAAAESCRAQFDATLADITEKLSASNAEVASLKAAQADFDSKVKAEAEKQAQAKTDSIMGRIGQPPLAGGASATPSSAKVPTNLTGLARVTAAFKSHNHK